MGKILTPPFPWFGGKRRVANYIWSRLGDPRVYIEPFAGSAATLLAKPGPAAYLEILNDACHYLINFWRSVQNDPDSVAKIAFMPSNECELHARHQWLMDCDLTECYNNPEYYNVQAAGYWLYGIRLWIGSGWCRKNDARRPHHKHAKIVKASKFPERRPCIQDKTVPDKKPVHNQIQRVNRPSKMDFGLDSYKKMLHELQDRLINTKVICGDWKRCVTHVLTEYPLRKNTSDTLAIFFDPPYLSQKRDKGIYTVDKPDVCHEVIDYCKLHQDDPRWRICLAGYEGDYDLPGWDVYAWKSTGGYSKHRTNNAQERLYFSPHCLALS